MSNLKIVNNLFLEKEELKRFQKFGTQEGYEMDTLHNSENFGFVRNYHLDPNNTWLSVTTSDTLGVAKLLPGYAIDKDHKRLSLEEEQRIIIPQDGLWYWIRLEHIYKTTEIGTVSIGGTNQSLMTGIGTKFTEILRGQPNFPSKIRFLNSQNYIQEYEVLEVIDDNNCLIQGVFETLESGLQYISIGTFTPGYYPPSEDKEIFEYDHLNFTILQEQQENIKPSYVEGKQFYTCRIKNDSGNLEIQDYRYEFQFKTRAESLINKITREQNPLIAIESIRKYNFNNDIFYCVNIEWKFNIQNQNINTTLKTATITNGSGGKFKTINDFTQGDFNGWRYYYENGEYSNVLESIKNTDNTITLVLEDLKITSGQGHCVCPNADEIGLIFNFDLQPNKQYSSDYFEFPINKTNTNIIFNENRLSKLNQFCDVKFFYKSNQVSSNIYELNVNDYYIEKAFNENGDLIDNSQKITNQDLYFNGGVNPGNIDGWNQYYPNEYALMYGNEQRIINASTVASKLYYKFFGSNTVKIQGRINLTLNSEPNINGGLLPNGVRFTTPFTWFDDTVGNRFIRSFVGNIRYKTPTDKTNFELTRLELYYEPSNTSTGEDSPTDKIIIRYLKNGVGELSEPDDTSGNVSYENPLPAGTSLEFDVDMMIYFDSFNKNYVNGPVGTDNTNPNVASGGLPSISNYSIAAYIGEGFNNFNCNLMRNSSEVNYKVKVDFIIKYKRRITAWAYLNRQVSGSQIFNISDTTKSINIPTYEHISLLTEAKITGVTLL